MIHKLKINDRHFVTLASRFETVNKEIHVIEAGVEAASDERLEDLKKKRLAVLDELAQVIGKAAGAEA